MAIRPVNERWVADWVAASSRQKDGTWIFHIVTASVTRAAHTGAQHGRQGSPVRPPALDRSAGGWPGAGGRAGRGGAATGGAATTGTAKAVVTG